MLLSKFPSAKHCVVWGVAVLLLYVAGWLWWGRGRTTQLDLFFMSHCPYGREALAKVISVAELDHRSKPCFHYIAQDRKASDSGGQIGFPEGETGCSAGIMTDAEAKGRFASLHGQPEIDEEMRQVIIARCWPDRLIPYLKRFLQSAQADWRAHCAAVGIPPDELARRLVSSEASEWFAENIQESRKRRIYLSPTLIVNGREIRSVRKSLLALRYELCSLGVIKSGCEGIRCRTTAQCPAKPGYRAACRQGRCIYRRASPSANAVTAFVILPFGCNACRITPVVNLLAPWLDHLNIQNLDLGASQAQDILRACRVKEFPVLALPSSIASFSWGNELLIKLQATRAGEWYLVSVNNTMIPFQTYGRIQRDANGVHVDFSPSTTALLLHQAGYGQLAANDYWSTLAVNQNDPQAWNNLGAILYDRQNMRQSAGTMFEKALKTNPDYEPALRNMIRYHVENGKRADAATFKDRLAWILCRRANWREAAALFKDVVDADQSRYDAQKGLAWALVRLERPAEAIPHLLKCVEIKKSVEPDLANLLAGAYFRTGRKKDAMAWYLRASQGDKPSQEAVTNLIGLFRQENDWERMLATADTGIKHWPEQQNFCFERSEALWRLGRQRESMDVLNSLRKRSNIPATRIDYEVAWRFAEQGQREAFVRHASQMIQMLRQTPNLRLKEELLGIAKIALDLKSYRLAVDGLKLVLSCEPSNVEAHKLLATCYESLGDRKARDDHLRLAKEFGG